VASDAVTALLPWYGSVHRGAGALSQRCTLAYEQSRQTRRRLRRRPPRRSRDLHPQHDRALNLLAAALPTGATVVTYGKEHHANLLP
jgi:selenocysteine lyase/cysteine desulfurase